MSRDSALRGFLLGLVFAAIAIPILECDGLGAASSQRLQQRGSSRASPRSRLAEKDEENTAVSRQRARLGAKNSTVIGSIIKKPAAKTVKWAKVGTWLCSCCSAACITMGLPSLCSSPRLYPYLSLPLSTAFFDMRNTSMSRLQDVVGRAVQRTSKMCCQLPRHFFNKTAMRALLDVSDDSASLSHTFFAPRTASPRTEQCSGIRQKRREITRMRMRNLHAVLHDGELSRAFCVLYDIFCLLTVLCRWAGQEDDDQKKSLHDSELENPWLSDLDLETDPTLLNGREERFLDGQDHHHGHRHRRKGG
jgi:hypothetical protein